jgi:hypothetical protein
MSGVPSNKACDQCKNFIKKEIIIDLFFFKNNFFNNFVRILYREQARVGFNSKAMVR